MKYVGFRESDFDSRVSYIAEIEFRSLVKTIYKEDKGGFVSSDEISREFAEYIERDMYSKKWIAPRVLSHFKCCYRGNGDVLIDGEKIRRRGFRGISKKTEQEIAEYIENNPTI